MQTTVYYFRLRLDIYMMNYLLLLNIGNRFKTPTKYRTNSCVDQL